METHVLSMEDSSGYRHDEVVTAADAEVARRIFAMRMLKESEKTLEDEDEKSLSSYAPVSALQENWRVADACNCPRCRACRTRLLTDRETAERGLSPMDHAGRVRICASCAGTWLDLGVDPEERSEIERDALVETASLDAFERASLDGEAIE